MPQNEASALLNLGSAYGAWGKPEEAAESFIGVTLHECC
jgi:hypothetical protein